LVLSYFVVHSSGSSNKTMLLLIHSPNDTYCQQYRHWALNQMVTTLPQ
jgi:hypothetical protein